MLTDWLAVVSALLTAIGLIFAGLQVRHLWQQRSAEDRLAVEGVSVSWQPLSKPNRPGRDGAATWVYEVVVHNPGRYPISDVAAEVTFPVPVHRKHQDGSLDEARRTLRLEQSVIYGGAERNWTRTLVMDYAAAHSRLKETAGVVNFTDIKGSRKETTWPRRADQTPPD